MTATLFGHVRVSKTELWNQPGSHFALCVLALCLVPFLSYRRFPYSKGGFGRKQVTHRPGHKSTKGEAEGLHIDSSHSTILGVFTQMQVLFNTPQESVQRTAP